MASLSYVAVGRRPDGGSHFWMFGLVKEQEHLLWLNNARDYYTAIGVGF